MDFSLELKTARLSVGEFADFRLGPQDAGSGGPQGIWRAQLGQHWHNELRARTEKEFTPDGGTLRSDVLFEVVIDGQLTHRGWTISLNGRIDQQVGDTLREIKSVMRPLPVDEATLRAEYPEYFRQIATYAVLRRAQGFKATRAELIFVEAGAGLSQTIALTPFDEALVSHQLDALVGFLNLRLRAHERRRHLVFRPAFDSLRLGQETIQADLSNALATSPIVLFEAPTGYGKTGCLLEFALGKLKAGKFERVIWLTGKSTGQIQVVHTLQQMTAPAQSVCHTLYDKPNAPFPFWQVRNKSEHCVNHSFHCVRDNCDFLRDCGERWPGSGLAKFYLDEKQPRDLPTLREAGLEARICPYEITRTALPFNDVWIGDFNYVFAPDNRGIFYERPGFNPAETLLIIDEAHNLSSRVASAHSHHATDTDARLLLAQLDHIEAPAALLLAVDEWARLLGSLYPSESLDPPVENEVHDLVARIANLVSTKPLDYAALGQRHADALWEFAALGDFLNNEKLKKLLWVAKTGELEFTCVDAADWIGETLSDYGGAVLMSATLNPYEAFADACGLKNTAALTSPIYTKLQAPTPWRAGAYDIAVDLRVDTSFKQRANHSGTTAATIEALHAAAGSAVAVFFPSYAYAENIRQSLERSGSVLRVVLQPKLPDLAAQTAWVEENLALADALFLVLGSSFAEGIDLLGGRVTHAMVVGPALPEVNAVQKARVDALHALGREAAFRRVYQIPGLQKVNQALGRLVRAPGHHAKVLLHCRRFAEPSYASLLATDYQLYEEIFTEKDLGDWLATSARDSNSP
ncbi:ATP-dependent DNA helicase [Oleiharenicola lentus]|uniref:ATP-dependent DNA helicase n=1 Tax=Oleiharenicola lentus TaxID=2508720 RepID=UPI003F66822E